MADEGLNPVSGQAAVCVDAYVTADVLRGCQDVLAPDQVTHSPCLSATELAISDDLDIDAFARDVADRLRAGANNAAAGVIAGVGSTR